MDPKRLLTFAALDDMIRSRSGALYGRYKTDCGWQPLSWANFRQSYLRVAALLKRLHGGGAPVVGILAETRLEWNICDFATLAIGGVVVGLYSNDRDEVLHHVLSTSRPDVLVVMNQDLLRRVRASAPEWGTSRPVIVMEGLPHQDGMSHSLERCLAEEIDAAELAAVENGMSLLRENQPASYVFSSGTSGLPKAAILTQGNLFHSAAVYARNFPLTKADSSLVYLPFAHVFARVMYYAGIYWGLCFHYTRRIEELVDDFRAVDPTVVLVVPRLLEKVQAKVQAKAAAGGVQSRRLFAWATAIGRQYYVEGRREPLLRLQVPLARALVLNKVARLFGRRLRFIGSGGGHLPAHVADFFQQFGILVYEGYASTESGGLGVFNHPTAARTGTVGRAVPEVEVGLEADGEIRLRGPSIFAGYLGDPAATSEVLRDGWLLTGDLGQFDDDGFLVVLDRKKDLLVTAYGKKVAPSWLEERLMTSAAIDDAVVFGDGRPHLVALIVPDEALLSRYGHDFADPRLRDDVEEEVRRINERLSRHEQIRRFALVASFDIGSGTMTSTFKKRRKAIYERYRAEIEMLYETQPEMATA